jgi:hypothetical protein
VGSANAEIFEATEEAIADELMNLLHLASDIQETILFLPRTASGRDPITERELRALTRIVGWSEQRRAWAELLGGRPSAPK